MSSMRRRRSFDQSGQSGGARGLATLASSPPAAPAHCGPHTLGATLASFTAIRGCGTRGAVRVAEDFVRAHPRAPRLAVGDLSRPHGGRFGARYSSRLLHASHQNALDVDIYYPRRDRRERAPSAVDDIALELSQDLVDRCVRAGAQLVLVGPNSSLSWPRRIVQALRRHDNHLHVRLAPG